MKGCELHRMDVKKVLIIVMVTLFLPAAQKTLANERLFLIDDVKLESQFPELPSGCEITAAAMLLNYFGASTTKTDVADLIPKGSIPRLVNHSYVGGNPNEVFVGDPYSEAGYGVFEKPILNIIDHYFPGKAKDLTGSSFDDLLSAVRGGTPVVVWVTINLEEPVQVDEWVDSEGNTVYWNAPEHAMLFVGWDDDKGYFNDPYTGKRAVYNLWTFKDRWEKMGSRAVTLEQHSPVVTSLTYEKFDSDISIGSSISIPNIIANYDNGQHLDVTSSVQIACNDSIVKIDGKTITGISLGKTQIHISYADQSVILDLTVSEAPIFNDIKHHWAFDTILWSHKHNIVQGYQDGSFKPDHTVTEAEFLAMIFRMYPESIKTLHMNPPSNGVWSDIYYMYANKYNLGLDGNNRNRVINRSDAAQIISGLSGKNYVNNEDAIKFLLDSGYSQGKTSATVSGYGGSYSLTRAEALQFLKNLQDKGFITLKARPIRP